MNFIRDLQTNVYCRIGVSKIHGVGVFAIKPIPPGINPMKSSRPDKFRMVTAGLLNKAGLPPEILKLVNDMCPQRGKIFDVPSYSLNEIGVAWYLNHSKQPNMEERDGDFYTTRGIFVGEELLVDYGTYGALNL